MKILMTTLNSKFVHSNLAIKYLSKCMVDLQPKTKEYTINEDIENIFFDIIKEGYDLVAFSCYIWNIERTLKIIRNIKKARPETIILLGGPEVSYQVKDFMAENPEVDMIIAGEGERAFISLNQIVLDYEDAKGQEEIIQSQKENNILFKDFLIQRLNEGAEIPNLFINRGDGVINYSEPEKLSKSMVIDDLSMVPMAYADVTKEDLENKIVYYETSRGCNYSCSYCLSAAHKGIRYFDEERVHGELKKLVDLGAGQIKLVDRTFNSDLGRTKRLIEYITKIDNGKINFHFEITAHLLTKEQLQMLKAARPGLFQLEIGVQSTHDQTLLAVHRGNNFEKLKENVLEIQKAANIHQHLDLIAGLPFENLERFKKSFNDVFALQPEMLQLGFLKLLKGSPIYNQIDQYAYVFRDYPPYEVISNKFMKPRDLIELKEVEDVLDRYYNKQRYKNAISYIYDYYQNGYKLFKDLSEIVEVNKIELSQKNQEFRAMLLLSEKIKAEADEKHYNHEFFVELLRLDYLMMGRNPNVPDFLRSSHLSPKEEIFNILLEDQSLRDLGFEDHLIAKEAFKKINWSNFDYDVLLYYNKREIIKTKNVVIINYSYQKKGIESYRAIRREYEIQN